MDISTNGQRQRFSAWLRTGRLPTPAADGIERKFNPWHDPANGRFTFADSGHTGGGWMDGGFSGGGGSERGYGGAGSQGSWEVAAKRPKAGVPSSRAVEPTHRSISPAAVAPATSQITRQSLPDTSQFQRITRNGYEYQIDSTNGQGACQAR